MSFSDASIKDLIAVLAGLSVGTAGSGVLPTLLKQNKVGTTNDVLDIEETATNPLEEPLFDRRGTPTITQLELQELRAVREALKDEDRTKSAQERARDEERAFARQAGMGDTVFETTDDIEIVERTTSDGRRFFTIKRKEQDFP